MQIEQLGDETLLFPSNEREEDNDGFSEHEVMRVSVIELLGRAAAGINVPLDLIQAQALASYILNTEKDEATADTSPIVGEQASAGFLVALQNAAHQDKDGFSRIAKRMAKQIKDENIIRLSIGLIPDSPVDLDF